MLWFLLLFEHWILWLLLNTTMFSYDHRSLHCFHFWLLLQEKWAVSRVLGCYMLMYLAWCTLALFISARYPILCMFIAFQFIISSPRFYLCLLINSVGPSWATKKYIKSLVLSDLLVGGCVLCSSLNKCFLTIRNAPPGPRGSLPVFIFPYS